MAVVVADMGTILEALLRRSGIAVPKRSRTNGPDYTAAAGGVNQDCGRGCVNQRRRGGGAGQM
jgi:hypothetical protein